MPHQEGGLSDQEVALAREMNAQGLSPKRIAERLLEVRAEQADEARRNRGIARSLIVYLDAKLAAAVLRLGWWLPLALPVFLFMVLGRHHKLLYAILGLAGWGVWLLFYTRSVGRKNVE